MDVYVGNAGADSKNYRHWFIGNFIKPVDSLRTNSQVEIKWGSHKAGEKREKWSEKNSVTTLSLLIYGKINIILPEKEIILEKEGDYIILGPETTHKWETLEDTLIITIRWRL